MARCTKLFVARALEERERGNEAEGGPPTGQDEGLEGGKEERRTSRPPGRRHQVWRTSVSLRLTASTKEVPS